MAGDEQPQHIIVQSPVEVRITNEMLTVLQQLMGPTGLPVSAGASGSGTALVDMLLKLLDPSGDKVSARSDEQRLLRNRPYEPFRRVAAAALGAGWVTYYTCPANSIALVRVAFGHQAAAAAATIGLRVQGIAHAVGVPIYGGAPGPAYQFTLQAAEIVEAIQLTGANATISVEAALYSVGDTNTGV